MEASGVRPPSKKKSMKVSTTVQSLSFDALCIIFSFLDLIDLIRCSAVCKSWSLAVDKSVLFQLLYREQQSGQSTLHLDTSPCPEISSKMLLKDLAMDQHRLSLQEGSIDIYQWKGHVARVSQCRMKMGLALTGGGDKVMRLWSVESYKCLDEYFLPDNAPLIDFDFDESKIVGLVGARICVWKRNGKRNIFSSREGGISKGSCMSYVDPEAVVGCEDGRACVFDMYSRKWSKIVKIHDGPVTCLSLSDSQMIFAGSSVGTITISDLSSDQRVATLKSYGSAVISTLCLDPSSPLLFAGSTAGQAFCWDLRTMRSLWQTKVSPNVIFSIQNYASMLVMGGIDGVLRIIDQNTGEILSRCFLDKYSIKYSRSILDKYSRSPGPENPNNVVMRKGRRISDDTRLDLMPRAFKPSINCLAVGFQKVVTTHDDNYIRVWKFRK